MAEVRELPGVISQGKTPEDAVRNVYDAMAGWISGRLLLRLPRGLHAELARPAKGLTTARLSGQARSRAAPRPPRGLPR